MEKIKRFIKNEFISGQTKFDWTFMLIGIIIQIAAIIYTCINPNGLTNSQIFWTAVSGLTGIVSVVLCAEGKISFYFFGYIQLFTYVFAVAIPAGLWGEVGENVFYLITMIIGTIIWWKNYKTGTGEVQQVKSKTLTKNQGVLTFIILTVSTFVLGVVLTHMHEWSWLNWLTDGRADPQPWLDSITTTAPFIAQILLMLGYRDQWTFWIIEDIISLIMFSIPGPTFSPIMIAQYLFWTVNCVYGWIKWNKEAKGRLNGKLD